MIFFQFRFGRTRATQDITRDNVEYTHARVCTYTFRCWEISTKGDDRIVKLYMRTLCETRTYVYLGCPFVILLLKAFSTTEEGTRGNYWLRPARIYVFKNNIECSRQDKKKKKIKKSEEETKKNEK